MPKRAPVVLTALSCDTRPSHLPGRTARRTGSNGHATPIGSLERMGAPKSFARNTEIYGENYPADCIYHVVSGAVRTCRTLPDGRRQIGGFYLPGDVFGLEAGARHAFSAEAVTDAKVLAVRCDETVARATPDTEVASHQLWALMAGELERAQDHVYLLIKTAPERVASFLLELARRLQSSDELELPMSRRDIADYLGLTIETVSRTLTQLEKASAIALPTSRRIVLRDRAVLEQLIA